MRKVISFLLTFSVLFSCGCTKKHSQKEDESPSIFAPFYTTQSEVIELPDVVDAFYWGDYTVVQSYNEKYDDMGEVTTSESLYVLDNNGEVFQQVDLNSELGPSNCMRAIRFYQDSCWILTGQLDDEYMYMYSMDQFTLNNGFSNHIELDFSNQLQNEWEGLFISQFLPIDETQIIFEVKLYRVENDDYRSEDSFICINESGQVIDEFDYPDPSCASFVLWNGQVIALGHNDENETVLYTYNQSKNQWTNENVSCDAFCSLVPAGDYLLGITNQKIENISQNEYCSFLLSDVSVYGSVSDIRMLDDGKIDLLSLATNNRMIVFYHLTPSDVEPVKEEFVIAGYNISESYLPALVEDMSFRHPDLKIVIRDYMYEINETDGKDWNQSQNDLFALMSLDIASGNEPDLYFDIQDDTGLGELGRLGYLMDLSTLVNSLDENDYFIDKIMMGQKTPYCICSLFNINCFEASGKFVSNTDRWTYEDFYSCASQFSDLSCIQTVYSKSTLFEMGVLAQMDTFIQNGEGNFESNDFIRLLTWCNEIGRRTDWDEYVFPELNDGLFMFDYATISNPSSLLSIELEHEFVGYPNENGSLHVFPGCVWAVSSTTDKSDLAFEMIQYALSEDFQLRYSNVGYIPVNRNAFNQDFENDYQSMADEVNDTFGSKEVYYDKYMETIDRADRYLHGYQAIVDVCIDEANAYFSGDISAEDAAELIQNRVTLYLQETATNESGVITIPTSTTETTTESSQSAVISQSTDQSNDQTNDHKVIFTRMSPEEMEQGFKDTAEELQMYFTVTNNDSFSINYGVWQDIARNYDYSNYDTLSYIEIRVCPDVAGSKTIYQSIISYGGLYNEDYLCEEIVIEEDNMCLQMYYCTYEDGVRHFSAYGYIDNIEIGFDSHGDEEIDKAEQLLLAMGIDLNA